MKTQIKIFAVGSHNTIENNLNEWLEEMSKDRKFELIDIKFSTIFNSRSYTFHCQAMVLYRMLN